MSLADKLAQPFAFNIKIIPIVQGALIYKSKSILHSRFINKKF